VSMITPPGLGGRRSASARRSGRRRVRARRLLALLLVLSVGGASGWWFGLRDTSVPATAALRPGCSGTPSPASAARPGPTGAPGADRSVALAAAGTRAQPTARPARPAPTRRPSPIVVRVLNDTPRQGLAAAVGRQLTARGFRVSAIGNDPSPARVTGTVELRHGRRGVLAAQTVARHISGARTRLDARPDPGVDVVLGAGFRRLATGAEIAAAQAAQAKAAAAQRATAAPC